MAANVGGFKPGMGHLITRDFLGLCRSKESKEMELDQRAPTGWEKRLDLQPREVSIQRRMSTTPTNVYEKNKSTIQTSPYILNLPLSSSINHENSTYQSVWNLDKVESALERARKVPPSLKRRRFPPDSNSSTFTLYNNIKDLDSKRSPPSHSGFVCDLNKNDEMMLRICPNCLMYVLIPKAKTMSPRCNAITQMPRFTSKRQQIDLELSL